MAEARFELAVEVGAAPEAAIAFLADLHRVRALHPLIVRVDDLAPAPERPAARRYRVTDRLRVGPLRLRAVYVAELERVSPRELRGTAWQRPRVEVYTRYRAEPAPGGARLVERALVRAPWPLLGTVRRRAEAAHREMLAGLGTALAAEARSGRG